MHLNLRTHPAQLNQKVAVVIHGIDIGKTVLFPCCWTIARYSIKRWCVCYDGFTTKQYQSITLTKMFFKYNYD